MERAPSTTPRRTHLKTLSLAQIPSANGLSRSFSGPAPATSYSSPNSKTTVGEKPAGDSPGTPSTWQSFHTTPSGSLPTTPATPGTASTRTPGGSLARASSIGRNPMRRKPSISYSPSFRENLSPDGAGPLGRRSPMLGGTPRSPSAFGLGISEEEPSEVEATTATTTTEAGESVGPIEGGRSIGLGKSPRRTRSSMENPTAGTTASPAAQAMTLAEKHADLLSFIAQKESKCLELREQLAQNEAELANLKKKWTTVVSRASARSANEANPSLSSSQNGASNNSVGGSGSGGSGFSNGPLGAQPEGLLSSETIQSGKRLLNLVLGVDLDEPTSSPASVSPPSDQTPLPTPPPQAGPTSSLSSSASSTGSPSNQAPVRHKYTSSSLSSSSLEKVSEAPEDPLSASLFSKPETNPTTYRPVPPSRSAAHTTRRLSMLSHSSGSSVDSTVPSVSQGSIDLMTGNSWDPDSVLSEEGEDDVVRLERGDARGLMEGLAASSGVSTSGWGKKFGELAQGLSGNEHFLQSKRATLSFTSSLSSAFSFSPLGPPPAASNQNALSSDPELSTSPTPSSSLSLPSPLKLSRSNFSSSSSSSSSTSSSKLKATKMRPLSKPTGGAHSPGFGRALTSPTGPPNRMSESIEGADFFGPDGLNEVKSLQTPLEPVGRAVSVSGSDNNNNKQDTERDTLDVKSRVESEGDWNW